MIRKTDRYLIATLKTGAVVRRARPEEKATTPRAREVAESSCVRCRRPIGTETVFVTVARKRYHLDCIRALLLSTYYK